MPKFFFRVSPWLALFLLIIKLMGCLDYQEARVIGENSANVPPMINFQSISPLPRKDEQHKLVIPINVGVGCNVGTDFIVRTIDDPDSDDKLYYVWFFDNTMAPPGMGVIQASDRKRAHISLTVNRALIEKCRSTPLTTEMFSGEHLLELYVADREYTVPETLLLNEPGLHQDHLYWVVKLIDTPC